MSLNRRIDYTEVNKNKKFANEEVAEEVADELGLPLYFVKDIIKTNSNLAKEVIERGAFESFTLPYLGKLKAKLRSVQMASGNVNRS